MFSFLYFVSNNETGLKNFKPKIILKHNICKMSLQKCDTLFWHDVNVCFSQGHVKVSQITSHMKCTCMWVLLCPFQAEVGYNFYIVIRKLAKFEFSLYQGTNKQWVRVYIHVIIIETSAIWIVYFTNQHFFCKKSLWNSVYRSQESITQHHLDQDKPYICKLCVKSASKCKWGFFHLGRCENNRTKSPLLGYTPKTKYIIISNLQIK